MSKKVVAGIFVAALAVAVNYGGVKVSSTEVQTIRLAEPEVTAEAEVIADEIDSALPNLDENAKFDYWEYSLENYPGVKYEMYYYQTKDPAYYAADCVGFFNDNGNREAAYLSIGADNIDLINGFNADSTIEDVKKLIGEPDRVNTTSANSVDLIYDVNGASAEISFYEGKITGIELIDNELFDKYQDSNDLEEISQDILAINYGKLLNDGVTPESYLAGINEALAHGGPIGPRPW